MKIKIGKNHILTLNDIARTKFDLHKIFIRKRKKDEVEYKSEEVIASGVTLSHAMDIVANENLDDKEFASEVEFVKKKELLLKGLLKQFDQYSKSLSHGKVKNKD